MFDIRIYAIISKAPIATVRKATAIGVIFLFRFNFLTAYFILCKKASVRN